MKALPTVGWFSVALALLLTLSIGLSTPPTEHHGGRDEDGLRYEALSQYFLGDAHERALALGAPWCYRVLVPGVIALLALPAEQAFPTLSALSTFGTLFLLPLLLLSWGASAYGALLGQVLYAGVFWGAKFAFYSPFYIDSSVQFLLVAALYAWERRQLPLLSVLLFLGVLAKESTALLLPALFFVAVRTGEWLRLRRWFSIAAGGVVLALALPRFFLEAHNVYMPEAALLHTFLQQVTARSFWAVLPLEVVSGTGLLLLVALVQPAHILSHLRTRPILVALLFCGGIQLFGGWDKGRLFLPLLPALVFLAVMGMERCESFAGRCWAALTLLLHAYLGHLFTPIASYDAYLAWLVPLHATSSLEPHVWRVLLVVAVWGCGSYLLLPARAMERR